MPGITRQTLTIWVAAVAPLLLTVSFLLFQWLDSERRSLETLAANRADAVVRTVDGLITANLKLAQALATSTPMQQHDYAAAYQRAVEMSRIGGDWRSVSLTDPNSGLELFDLRRPWRPEPRPMGPDAVDGRHGPWVGDIEPFEGGGWAVPVSVPVPGPNGEPYRLTVYLDPETVQRASLPLYPEGAVAAVVDRRGRFISRSLNYTDRLGRPATHYVRSAVARGGFGVYEGRTFEGFVNHTAYSTSLVSGWSAHVAVSAAPIRQARIGGYAVWIFVGGVCLLVSGGAIWLALREMSQARLAEERARQSQKLEAIGQLTGGVAHDFNNLLTAIIGGLDLVLKRTDGGDPNRRYIDAALQAARRGARLTAGLLSFSRSQSLQIAAVDLVAVLDGITDLLEKSLGASFHIRGDIAPGARWVQADRNQLELALLNLALNARDAMPGGGELVISSRRTGPPIKGDYVEIVVADQGTGMTPEVRARAFEPFFTTKPMDKGTGLGLSQVFGMARQSGGSVAIETKKSEGTRVIITLPAANPQAVGPDLDEAAPASDSTTPSHRILLLDDDAEVRTVVLGGLESLGHTVTATASGEEALAILAASRPDLLVTDFRMPGMNGDEVARRARLLVPDQKVLFISGFADEDALAAAAAGAPLLRKPFDAASLAAAVHELLGSRAAPRSRRKAAPGRKTVPRPRR